MRKVKVAAVLGVIVLLVVAQRLGIFREASDPAHLAQTLVELGAWGYVAFVLTYAALQPFGIPGTVFVVAAPLIWPWPIAYGLSMVGTMAASVVGFSFARFVARDWLSPRVPVRFRKYDEALARRAFATVFLLRLIFWMPPLLHAFFGVSKVRFSTHFWGSFVGYLLPLFLMSFFGQKLFDVMRAAPPSTWVALGAAAVVIAGGVWLHRRRAASTAPPGPREADQFKSLRLGESERSPDREAAPD
jgi:uncharacterized membrane protein YdjX (TVP38/TMEM64 family)